MPRRRSLPASTPNRYSDLQAVNGSPVEVSLRIGSNDIVALACSH